MNDLLQLVSFFDSTSLDQMNGVKLLNRVDTKYIVSPAVFVKVLSEHINDYEVLEVNQKRCLSYNTIYFDTDDLSMYKEHHNGKNHRYKVRYRQYEETGDKFIEVKEKVKNRTVKQRLSVKNFTYPISKGLESLVHDCTPYRAEDLEPKLTTVFNRITLVNKKACERITIDMDIRFENEDQNRYSLGNCLIVEIKRDKEDVYSTFARSLKKQGVLPLSISKYCLGTVALNNSVKYNRFKPRLRKVENLIAQEELAMVV
ncbi:polyphosphate polymerase domain-containing protein [Carboxylicivirga sp. M1479]|uniref:polyphosphate polymerase domain-containing protein n=1 Tax=Carboxylicivirga sp. M1479 TaxID=2594476 RepID=UPI001177363B|nr:polyphosphate polymerase domain-containing protein [Carboxylicivirga sp. M1479]TRX65860.1 polyphosphate polymerase domain-containing protein [Carboxylicivirga sp. M1479]